MFEIHCYKVPPESIPLFRYYHDRTTDLNERYNDLMGDLNLMHYSDARTFNHLYIYTCGDDIDIKDIISKRGHKFLFEENIRKYDSLKSFPEEIKDSESLSFVVLHDETDQLNDICQKDEKKSNIRIFKVSNGSGTAKTNLHHQTKSKIPVVVTSIADIKSDIDNEIERIILQPLKFKFEVLKRLLNDKKYLDLGIDSSSCQNEIEFSGRPTFENKLSDIDKQEMTRSGQLCFCNVIRNVRKMSRADDIKAEYDNDKSSETVESQIESARLHAIDRDTAEGLLMEMDAVLKQSNIQDRERSDIDSSKVNTDQIMKELSDEYPTMIQGVGFHYSCFTVYVKQKGKDMKDIDPLVQRVLKKYQINDYKIEFVSETKLYSKYDISVGSTIKRHKDKFATLGCFAETKDKENKDTYILTSKHVAVAGKTFQLHTNDNKQKEILAERLETSITGDGLDIAVLKLIQNQTILRCTRFKEECCCDDDDDDEISLQGKLHQYKEDSTSDIVCFGQKVHIWGAISKPGKGVITTIKYKKGDMKALILIEDRVPKCETNPERFCRPGDSGAIVCVEDKKGQFVHIIAMIMGIINDDELKRNPKTRGKYLTVPLSSGLKELDERTNLSFRICDSIDS